MNIVLMLSIVVPILIVAAFGLAVLLLFKTH